MNVVCVLIIKYTLRERRKVSVGPRLSEPTLKIFTLATLSTLENKTTESPRVLIFDPVLNVSSCNRNFFHICQYSTTYDASTCSHVTKTYGTDSPASFAFTLLF